MATFNLPPTRGTKLDIMVLLTTLVLTFVTVCNGAAVVRFGMTTVNGLETTVGKTTLWKFLGIRYAQAPVGYNRFQRPQAESMPRQVDATQYRSRCPAFPLEDDMSEDCLFLNIVAPQLHSNQRLPVFVWIHGGGFVTGSSNTVEADVLAAEGGVVVVTFNYRLGPLGFLCTGDQASLGNYGLWDQRMALTWVSQYIHFFGGEPSRVTVGGMSAGAASASFLSLTPRARDLFQRVVQLSGSALSPWARVSGDEALEATRRLALNVGCFTEESSNKVNTAAIVGCLRSKPLADLITATQKVWNDSATALVDYVWVPVTDGQIVVDLATADPFEGPLLAGLVNNEGGLLTDWGTRRVSMRFPDIKTQMHDRDFYVEQFLPALLRQSYSGMATTRASLLLDCAYGQDDDDDEDSDEEDEDYDEEDEDYDDGRVRNRELEGVFGDQAFVYSTIEYLNRFSASQPSYLYYMDHQPDRPGIKGVRHGEDQLYLFAFLPEVMSEIMKFPSNISRKDMELSRDLRTLVVNFIKTGDPNKMERPESWPAWPRYDPKEGSYLVMSSSPEVASRLREDYVKLWTEDLPTLLTSDNVTAKWRHCFSGSSASRKYPGFAGVWGLLCVSVLIRMIVDKF